MNAIKEQRLKCGLTRSQLAKAVGKTVSTIRRWETNEFRPSDECFPKLAEALSCDMELIWIAPVAAVRRVPTEEEKAIWAENREKIAPYIAEREKQGLSKRQLAEKAGVDASTIYTMENGRYYPCWETRQKLRRALGMPEERLYTEEERNEIFFQLEELGVIRLAIRKKWEKLRAAHADIDDLYQDLSLCALRAIGRFQPDGKATLKTFVERNMDFFIERWIIKTCMHGISGKVHYPLPEIQVFSLDALMENGFNPVG